MRERVLGIARAVVRKTIPAPLRLRAWGWFGERYFDYSSIKRIIAYAKANHRQLTSDVKVLIGILEHNGHQRSYQLINQKMGLDFKAFSCQDLIVYLFFNGKPSGFYIDIGAFDGVEISNTYALEKLGWDGVCIEPIPEIYALLQSNRQCHHYNVAISADTRVGVNFLKVSELLGLSGLEQQMPERIRSGLEKQGLDIEQIIVNTMTFGDVMESHPDLTNIDFLSIDVEGGELDVLKTIDFTRFRFGLITIENNCGTAILRDFMQQRGYVIFMDLGVDLMFVPLGQQIA